MPSGPSSTRHVIGIVCERNTDESTPRSASSSALRRIGCGITSWCAWSGPSSSRFASEPTRRADRHHDRLADRVDRRVGHLREQLLEVGEQRRRLVGQDREREVVAHRADRLLALRRHRREQHAQVLLRVAERELARAQRLARARAPGARGRSCSRTTPSRYQSPYGFAVATRRLTSSSLDDPALGEVDQEQLARLQAALAQDVRRPARRARRPPSASTTQPSFVSSQRPGRRPLRSSVAPITRPSVNAIAAGPSHGSITQEWNA